MNLDRVNVFNSLHTKISHVINFPFFFFFILNGANKVKIIIKITQKEDEETTTYRCYYFKLRTRSKMIQISVKILIY